MSRIPPINRTLFTSPNGGGRAFEASEASAEGSGGGALLARARALRQFATPSERMLWAKLRELRKQGHHFCRQLRVGHVIADFACRRAKLIVELDGNHHGEQQTIRDDEARTAFLATRGYRVLRFWNQEVFEDRDGVVEAILRALAPTRNASHSDLPRWGR
jgi:very-short-patch-repair endonuclease